MTTPFASGTAKVAGFLVVLLAVFAIAVGVGNAVGPVAETAAADDPGTHDPAGHDASDEAEPTSPSSGAMDDTTSIPGGLMVSQNGYGLSLTEPEVSFGTAVPVSFTVDGPDGEPVTEYDVAHEKQLHLIAVRRDFTGFQHVHPELDAAGRWSTELDLTAGQWRLFTDFKATGAEPVTLGADLAVSGAYQPVTPEPESRTAQVDRYTVAIDGDLVPGTDAELRLSVSRDGKPVTDLRPYLGSYGHLVALRSGDLAYLHVHPDGAPGDGNTRPGPGVVFYAAVPSAGTYHLYLDFKHQGVVRTAAFTVTTSDAKGSGEPIGDRTESPSPESGHGGH